MRKILPYISRIVAILIITIAVLVLFGWHHDYVLFKQVMPNLIAMNPLTAIAFLLAGFSYLLLLLLPSASFYQRLLTGGLALMVLLISIVKLLAVAGIYDAGIDRWLYADKVNVTVYQGLPSFMVTQSAVGFGFTGASLLLLTKRQITASQYLSLPGTLLGLLSVIGYIYHLSTRYQVTTFVPLSFHSGLCFLMLSASILFTKNKDGFIGEFTNPYAGGKAARLLFPASVAVPFIVGLLIVTAVLNGLISVVAGIAILVTAISLVFGLLIWITARIINGSESARLREREVLTKKLQQFNQELEEKVQEQTRQITGREQYFRLLLENMREGVQIINYDWIYVFANKSAVRQHHFTDEKKLVGMKLLDLYPAIEDSSIFSKLQTSMRERISQRFDYKHKFADGSSRYFYLSIQPVPEGLFILSTDITEQKLTQKRYHESQARYQTLINSVDGIVWEADAATLAITFVSKQAERLLGYPVEIWTTDPHFWMNHIYEEDRRWAPGYYMQCSQEQKSQQFEYRMVAADGQIVWIRDIVSLRLQDNHPMMLTGIMVDITETKKMEQELSAQQKLITETTILAQEKERHQLGLELHDNINQLLSVVRLFLGKLRADKSFDMSIINKSCEHLDDAIREIRQLSHSLVAPSLGQTGLKEAMEELIEMIQETNDLSILFFTNHDFPLQPVDKNKELMLYRIAQEQLTNIIKYAHASEISIHLKQFADQIYLCINDNGVGFNVEETSQGIGLKNIRSRVGFYSGMVQLTSAPGEGCTLEVYLPN